MALTARLLTEGCCHLKIPEPAGVNCLQEKKNSDFLLPKKHSDRIELTAEFALRLYCLYLLLFIFEIFIAWCKLKLSKYLMMYDYTVRMSESLAVDISPTFCRRTNKNSNV